MTQIRTTCYSVASVIALAIILALSIPLASSFGQGYLDLSDTDHIGLLLAGLKQDIMLWKPGEVHGVIGGKVSVDGVIMPPGKFNDSLKQIVDKVPQRKINPANPHAHELGIFYDFQLDFTSLSINGDQCDVPCTFGLPVTSGRFISGLIGLAKEDGYWRITRIDGLLPFLAAEIQLSNSVKKGQAAGQMPMKKRK